MNIQIASGITTLLDTVWNRRFTTKPFIYFNKNFKCYDQWTCAQIWLAAQKVSDNLSLIPSDTPILISLPNGPEFVAAFYACHMQKLMPAPIVTSEIWGRDEYLEYVRQTAERNGIKYIFCSPELVSEFEAMGLTTLVVTDFWKNKKSDGNELKPAPRNPSPNDIALLQFSSGSTSDSKGVLLTHKMILFNLAQMHDRMKSQPCDSFSIWLPMYHDMGLIGGLLFPVYLQADLHSSNPLDFMSNPIGWLKHLSEVKARLIVGPDFMYKLLVRKAKDIQEDLDLSSLRFCMTGAEPVLAKTCHDFVAAMAKHKLDPKSLMPVYGMAEAVLGVTFTEPMTGFHFKKVDGLATEWTSCGKPLGDFGLEIRNSSGEKLPENTVGEIFISSPSLTRGFYKKPELNDKLFRSGWYQTGDTGFLCDGELYITGRVKDLIIIRGRKIYSIDIESRILEKWRKEFARVAAVTASESALNTALIVAIEVRAMFGSPISKETILEALKSQYPDIEFKIYFVPKGSLPRTSSGKLKRYKIREFAQSGELDKLSKGGISLLAKNAIQTVRQVMMGLNTKYGDRESVKIENVDHLKSYIEKTFRQVSGVKGEIDFSASFGNFNLNANQRSDLANILHKEFEISKNTFEGFQSLNDLYRYLQTQEME